ncbi:hypothetical protein AURDEDRAFT_129257 [Auricularia subglabra TFB-10046 SS5]|nr:hypothetical protein AURDEDRAFT_129257 [Auricularia subglabra TFB-10046 SS5]
MFSRLLACSGLGANRPPRRHIHQLPPELLGECFEHLSLSDRIRAATVCSLWRSVAVDHAELWCDIENVKMRALAHLLARTKRLGVRLVAYAVHEGWIDSLCRTILPHMDHMRHLELELRPSKGREDFADLGHVLCAQAPLLEAFSLVVNGIQCAFRRTLFGGVSPNLRELRIGGWTFETPSAATQSVVTLHAPGGMLDGAGRRIPPFYTGAWSEMFSNIRELHLDSLSSTSGLSGPDNSFPPHLTTLVLEFNMWVSPTIADDTIALLRQANFTDLRELTLVNAHAPLVHIVLKDVDSVVSLELLRVGGPHIRLVTASGTALNFMSAHFDGLDDVLLQRSKILLPLRVLHLDDNVLGFIGSRTLSDLCLVAPEIERLVLTLGPDRAMGRGVLNAQHWGGRDSLSLRALRELRIEGAPHTRIWTDELAHFVCDALPVSSVRKVDRLVLMGVKIFDDRTLCAISVEKLDEIAEMFFDKITVVPLPRTQARPRTQRAEMFMEPTYVYENDV